MVDCLFFTNRRLVDYPPHYGIAGTCAGMSVPAGVKPGEKTHGCFKKNVDCGIIKSSGYDGYKLPGGSSSSCSSATDAAAPVIATVFVNYGVRALVVVASWCHTGVEVDLDIDWAALGLSPGSAKIILPEVPGIQKARPFTPWTKVEASSGFMAIIE